MTEMDPDCLFCKIVAGEIPAERVFEDEHVLGFRDISPQAPVHVLFIPKPHIATVNDIRDDQATLVGRLFLAARDFAAEQGIAEKGFRLIVNCNADGGQTVFHLHMHLLAGAKMPMGFGHSG
ncbi:MAG: histidine triad nucleotide-binding protein [Pseudomonadota bacterium]